MRHSRWATENPESALIQVRVNPWRDERAALAPRPVPVGLRMKPWRAERVALPIGIHINPFTEPRLCPVVGNLPRGLTSIGKLSARHYAGSEG